MQKRLLITRPAAACAVAVAALWTLSPPAGATIPPGRIVSVIPSDDEVSQFVGLPMRHVDDPLPAAPRLPDHLNQRDECRALFYTNTVDVWGQDYTAFRSQNWTYPPDPNGTFVSQSVGLFASTGAARDRFDSIYNANLFNGCNHADLHGPPMDEGISFEVYDFKTNNDVMIWTLAAKQYGQYTGYNYVYVAFHLNNVISISNIGQQGNPSQSVKRLTDHILNRVG